MTRKKPTTEASAAPQEPVPSAPEATPKPRKRATAAKPAARPASRRKTAAPIAKKSTATKSTAARSAKERPKLVRDSFTMPEADFALIAALKARALAQQRAAKKSELIRAGLHALQSLGDASLVAALDALEPIKTGRPKKGH